MGVKHSLNGYVYAAVCAISFGMNLVVANNGTGLDLCNANL